MIYLLALADNWSMSHSRPCWWAPLVVFHQSDALVCELPSQHPVLRVEHGALDWVQLRIPRIVKEGLPQGHRIRRFATVFDQGPSHWLGGSQRSSSWTHSWRQILHCRIKSNSHGWREWQLFYTAKAVMLASLLKELALGSNGLMFVSSRNDSISPGLRTAW